MSANPTNPNIASATVIQSPLLDANTGRVTFPWQKFFQQLQQWQMQAALNAGIGVTDGSDAAPGHVGEFISASVQDPAFIAATSGVPLDITSISLTAGDWDVQGQVATLSSVSGHIQNMQVWASTVSVTRPTQLVGGFHEIGGVNTTGVEEVCLPTGRMRLNLTVTTTVYLSTLVSFSGTCGALGFIGARRIR